MTAKRIFNGFILIVSSALLFSCSQDPIFYNISNETPPAESLVPGIPSHFVEAGGTFFLSNRADIWALQGTDWERVTVTGMQTGSSIEELVSDGTDLYARVVWDEGFVNLETKTVVYRLSGSASSLVATEIANTLAADYPLINRINMVNGTLVASVKRTGIADGIRYVYESAGSFVAFGGSTDLGEGSAIVASAYAEGTYFFATGRGVYYSNSFDSIVPTLIESTSGTEISGIRAFGSELLAWSHEGTLYRIDGTAPAETPSTSSTSADLETAHTIYDDGEFVALLIAYNYSATQNGYRELALTDPNTLPASLSLAIPGDSSASSTLDEAQYSSSMGRYLVYDMKRWDINGQSVLFAGTKMGLYYSTDRGDWKVWSSDTHSEFD